MSMLTAATWVTAFLLVMAGARKVVQPDPTSVALRAARLPSDPRLVRMSGVGEVGLGATVLLIGGVVPIALLAALHSGFAVFAGRQRRAGSDCGCFGTSGTPVTGVHVWLNVTLAGVALGAAALPGPALPSLIATQPVAGGVVAVLVGTGAAALRLLLTTASELTAAVALLEPDAAR